MIEYAKKEYSDAQILGILEPTIKKWFLEEHKEFSPPQKFAVMEIHKGNNVLISSPTGTGKTLASFLSIINELFFLAKNNLLEDKVYCLYVSPLKALSNDLEKNLNEPLKKIYKMAKDSGIELPKIRVGKRTGDTSTSERQKQLKKPPHIFITTPESLAIILNSPRMSSKLYGLKWIIVDEVHALADNKRGVHLSLSLERLTNYVEEEPARIGLSATISPLDEVAKFLVGFKNGKGRDCLVVDVSYVKKTDLRVVSPAQDLIYTSSEELHHNLYSTLDNLISAHKTTLIFTNTRSATERVVHYLKDKFGDRYINDIEAHHGSLSKKVRIDVENKLKEGKLKAVVSSTSLELGIDIGYIDLVVLLGSPKSISRALQRIGRSGHKLHDEAKGVIVVLDRDDLVECIVLAKKSMERMLDNIQVSFNALDVLSQHLVGMSLEKKWKVQEAYELAKRAYCYHELPYRDFVSVLRYLAGHYEQLESRHVYAKLWLDENTDMFGRKGKMIRMIYYTNLGTIPDESAARIVTRSDDFIGSVDESFLERLKKRDRFVLGGKVYEFLYARGMKGYVMPAYDRLPTIPSWFSEMLPLSFDLALNINSFRFEMQELLRKEKKLSIVEHLTKKYNLDEKTSLAVYNYFYEQFKYSKIPSSNEILVEDYIDELQRENLIFHTLFGRRTNDALSRAYAYVISKHKKCNVRVTISDNGFILTMPSYRRINMMDVIRFVHDDNIESLLRESLEGTELLKRRFRHVATRSFLVLRSYKGRQKTVGRQEMSSFILYHVLKKIDPDFPVIKETFREILEEAMDIRHAKLVLKKIKEHKAHFVVTEKTDLPSPFAHNLLLIGSTDAIMMENRKELLKLLHKQIMKKIGEP